MPGAFPGIGQASQAYQQRRQSQQQDRAKLDAWLSGTRTQEEARRGWADFVRQGYRASAPQTQPAAKTQPAADVTPATMAAVAPGSSWTPMVTPPARAQQQAVTTMAQQYDPNYWNSETGKAMMELASQRTAPEDAPLRNYYRAQSMVGQGARQEIVEGLTMDLEPEQAKAMKAWAEANPMLAFREYNKRFPAGSPRGGDEIRTSDDAILAAQAADALSQLKLSATTDDAILAGQSAGAFGPDQGLQVASPPVTPAGARESNLAPTTQVAPAQATETERLLERHLQQARLARGLREFPVTP